MAWWQEILGSSNSTLPASTLFPPPSLPPLSTFFPSSCPPYSFHFLPFSLSTSLFLTLLLTHWVLIVSVKLPISLCYFWEMSEKSAVGIYVYTLTLSNLPGQE